MVDIHSLLARVTLLRQGRRKFLKTIGGAAIATALPNAVFAAQPQAPSLALFWQPGFPSIEGCDLTLDTLQRVLVNNFTVTVLNERDLIAQLNAKRFDLLVTPYGSAFPKRAWPVLLKYLRDGGNWLNVGGVPLSTPVVRSGSEWRAQPKQASYHKQLGITHSFAVDAVENYIPTPELYVEAEYGKLIEARQIYELYVRLSSSNNEPDEAGSDGPHEGVVKPLMLALSRNNKPIAAPMVQIDRLLGEFAGGRWVFANFSGNIFGETVEILARRTVLGASRLEIKSNFACYKPGEIPSLSVELRRPRGDLRSRVTGDCIIQVFDTAASRIVSSFNLKLDVEDTRAKGSVKLPETTKLAPGLYNISARTTRNSLPVTHSNAFWIYDEQLLARGKPLTVDKHFFYRDGEVFPVTGTTYMASDKHRRFLFEPNPYVWDNDFREMKKAGVNMVRTGIWTGWKKYMPEPGKVDEATLRAFDAFLLTAHKHDIPVIFNFFAFLPETWGGANAYLDSRSTDAQRQFITAFTERCRHVDDLIWDLINEPSFCSPKYLWNCRPNYDEHEKELWKDWLKERYSVATDEQLRDQLQLRWRTTSDDPFDLPRLQDFESVNLIDDRLPLKTLDYRLFAQNMFIYWVQETTTAIRKNGNTKQLITVGQDEAGLGDSPNPQFFANEVDFTSMHNWWNNDDLVWDSVLAKTPSKLNLMEETGVMFYENSDGGAPWRSEEDVSRLLERKLALSFAADGAGFIEWIWNTNPYMNSTNEVGIGFHRVDGTPKPELEPFLRISKFMAQYGRYLRNRVSEPVALMIPHSQMFSPRSFALEATRRCVRAMYYHCGVPMQAVSEYMVPEYASQAKLLIVPSPRMMSHKSWRVLTEQAGRGATVVVSGPIDADDFSLPASRLWASAETLPVAEAETILLEGREYLIRYDGEKMQRLEKTVIQRPGITAQPIPWPHGSGWIMWCPLPLELGDSMPAIAALYRMGLSRAGISPIYTATPQTPAVLILPAVFRDVVLYTFVSETNRDTQMQVTHLESRTRFPVSVASGRAAMVLLERKTGKIIGRM